MKIRVNRKAFLETFKTASRVSDRGSLRDAFKYVKISASKEQGIIEMSATDGEVFLSIAMKADVSEAGDALFIASKTERILSESSNDELIISASDTKITITEPDAEFSLLTIDPREFPSMQTCETRRAFSFKTDDLVSCLSKVSFAAVREQATRYALTGVFIRESDKMLDFVATDGRRLSINRYADEEAATSDEHINVIIPLKMVDAIMSIARANGGKQCGLSFGEKHITFICDNVIVNSPKLEGSFPNYEEVIPKSFDGVVEVDAEKMLSAVRRASLMTDKDFSAVSMKMEPNKIALSASSVVSGETEVSVDCTASINGEPVTIQFNPKFLSEFLSEVDGGNVVIRFNSPNMPFVVQSGNNWTCVIMPVIGNT